MIEHWLTANSLCYHIGNMACISRMFDSYGFLRCFPFWFLNLYEYLAKQFSSPVLIFYFCWQQFHSRFLASYLLASIRQLGLICFCIFKSSVLLFAEILSFSFFLVNSECDVYLPVDNSLVYSYPKIFLVFSSLIFSLA